MKSDLKGKMIAISVMSVLHKMYFDANVREKRYLPSL